MRVMDRAPHLATRWSHHVGAYHQCSWDRPLCIEAGLAYPGMHNEVERCYPYASEAYLHLLAMRETFYDAPFIPESLYEVFK